MKKSLVFLAALLTIVIVSTAFNKDKKDFKNNYSYIPSGTFKLNNSNVSVQAFYMSSTEITNKQYKEFLNDLKDQGRTNEYQIAVPDTAAWSKAFKHDYYIPMQNLYFCHPAYDNYPVVNVSKQGAELYCKWLTKKMRAKYPKKNFNDFRLPTKAEWIYAAKGGNDSAVYSWGGSYVRNAKGCFLANFTHVGEQNIKKDSLGHLVIANKDEFLHGSIDDYSTDIVATSKSYSQNPFGLYNMCGNVAELVSDNNIAMGGSWSSPGFNIQVTSEEKVTNPKPTVGFRVISSFTTSK